MEIWGTLRTVNIPCIRMKLTSLDEQVLNEKQNWSIHEHPRALLHRGGGSMLIPGLIPIIPAIIPKNSEPVNPVHNLQDRYTRDLSCQTVVAFIVTATCRSRVYSTRSSVPFWEKKNAANVYSHTIK